MNICANAITLPDVVQTVFAGLAYHASVDPALKRAMNIQEPDLR